MKKFYYFTASWCGPCKMFGPVLKRIEKDFESKVNIEKIDIDENQEFARDFEVVSVPTVIQVDQNENEVKRIAGAFPYDTVVSEFNLATN